MVVYIFSGKLPLYKADLEVKQRLFLSCTLNRGLGEHPNRLKKVKCSRWRDE